MNMKRQAANNVHQVAVMFSVWMRPQKSSQLDLLCKACAVQAAYQNHAQYQQFCGSPLPCRITNIKLICFQICYVVLIFSEHEYKEFSDLKLL